MKNALFLTASLRALALCALAGCATSTPPDDAKAAPPDDISIDRSVPNDLAEDLATPVDQPTFDASLPDALVDRTAPNDLAPDAPPRDAPPVLDALVVDAAVVDALPPPLPYPTRTAYRIKGLQPDFWPYDEVSGNNTGGVAMNLVWAEWEPARRAPPCAATESLFDGRCYTVPAATDEAIAEWTRRGLVVTGVLYGSPAWARAARRCTPVAPGFEIFCAPDDVAEFARFARFIAQRYDGRRGHGRVADFVIWNEVNANDWFDIGCGQSAGACDTAAWINTYAALYGAAYDGIVAEQPSAKVLISLEHHFGTVYDRPAAANPLLSGETFLRGFAARVRPRAWRVAYHPYPPDLLRPAFSPDDDPQVTYGSLGVLLGWLRSEFGDVPSSWEVQLTESGVNSAAPGSTPDAQARGVCDSLRNALGTPGVESYIYHRMVDHPVEVRDGLGLGLRNADRSAKPAWAVWALANRNDLTPPMLSCGFEDLPYTRLRRSYNRARGHWASSRIAPSGFVEERAWRLWREPRAGAIALYECRVGTHNLLSRAASCEGLRPLGPVGYAAVEPFAGSVPIVRCRVGAGTDHFVTIDRGCEGQTFEEVLGYATGG